MIFNNIIENNQYIPNCILCKKPMHFYIAGFDKQPFLTQEYLYSKTKLIDNFIISSNKEIPIKINAKNNEITIGTELLQKMISVHLDFYKKCHTCLFQINFKFEAENLINKQYLPPTSLLKEELVYTSNNKKISIHTHYQPQYKYTVGPYIQNVSGIPIINNNSFTYIYLNNKYLAIPDFKFSKFKSLKSLNNYIKTLLIFI